VSLSDLLRFSLDEDGGHEVTLDEELDLLARYLDIQLIRFQDRLTLETEIDPVTLPLLVPRLILQPLAENAFVHGFGSMEGPGTLTITSGMDAGNLVLTVSDNGAGIPPGSRDGLGLGNSRARLRHLYGEAAELTLEPRVPAGAMTRLIIPAHTEPVTEADV
jgi:two-component system, LytTR family, sensor kinase